MQEAVNYAKEFSIDEAAAKFEVHHSTVRNWLKKAAGVTGTSSKTKVRQYDFSLKKSILKFAKTNTKKETCRVFGMPMRTLNEWIFREKASKHLGDEDNESENGSKWMVNPLYSEDECEEKIGIGTLKKMELQAKWDEEIDMINEKYKKQMEELEKKYDENMNELN